MGAFKKFRRLFGNARRDPIREDRREDQSELRAAKRSARGKRGTIRYLKGRVAHRKRTRGM